MVSANDIHITQPPDPRSHEEFSIPRIYESVCRYCGALDETGDEMCNKCFQKGDNA